MGYKTKVQSIKRKNSEQFYINFPMVLAHALEFEAGEEIEWVVADNGQLLVQRQNGIKRTTAKKTPKSKLKTQE